MRSGKNLILAAMHMLSSLMRAHAPLIAVPLQLYNSTNEVRDLTETQQIWTLHDASLVNNKPDNIWYTLHYPDVTYTLTFRRNLYFHNEL